MSRPLPAVRTDRAIIATLIAAVVCLLGMAFLSGFLNRGIPSQILLTSTGCQVARLAGARLVEQQQNCILQGYYRGGVLHSGATIDQGDGLRFEVAGSVIAGRVDDASFEAPRSSMQTLWGLVGGGLLALAGAILLVGIGWRANPEAKG